MKKRIALIGPIAIMVVVSIYISFSGNTVFSKADKAKNFSLPLVSSNEKLSFESLRGKVIFLNFFTTWCPGCREEIPHLEALHNKYNSRGLAVVGVSLDDASKEKVGEFAYKMGITYPIIMGNNKLIEDYGGVYMIPTSFLIDRSGTIKEKIIGARSTAELERTIFKLLIPIQKKLKVKHSS